MVVYKNTYFLKIPKVDIYTILKFFIILNIVYISTLGIFKIKIKFYKNTYNIFFKVV